MKLKPYINQDVNIYWKYLGDVTECHVELDKQEFVGKAIKHRLDKEHKELARVLSFWRVCKTMESLGRKDVVYDLVVWFFTQGRRTRRDKFVPYYDMIKNGDNVRTTLLEGYLKDAVNKFLEAKQSGEPNRRVIRLAMK